MKTKSEEWDDAESEANETLRDEAHKIPQSLIEKTPTEAPTEIEDFSKLSHAECFELLTELDNAHPKPVARLHALRRHVHAFQQGLQAPPNVFDANVRASIDKAEAERRKTNANRLEKLRAKLSSN